MPHQRPPTRPPTPYGAPVQPTKPPSISAFIGAIGAFMGFLVLLSYPYLSAIALAAAALTYLGLRRLKTRLEQEPEKERELTIPGLGTIEYRISPQ